MEVAGAREEGLESILKRTSCFQVTDGVPILTFDPSVENFLSTMEAISELCGGTEEKSFETESAEAKNAINGIKLPHFSSAAVPKVQKFPSTASAFDNDDFVLHVGGSVWALDWCPRLYQNIGCDVKCEYLAIAAHPTGSEYHKIGEQLSGRGFIQIWCFLHLGDKEELLIPGGVCCGGEGCKKVNEDSCVPKRRGRPRKTAPLIPTEINGASNIDVIDSPSGPFSVRGIAISNECCVSSEFSTNEEPKNSYGAGNLGGNKEVFEYSDNPIYGPRKCRGRPRKTPDAKTPGPRGRPRKHPISSSNGCAVIHGDRLLDSSLLSTSGDIGTLNRSSPISVGYYIEELQKGINSVSDLNERGKTLLCSGKPIQDGDIIIDDDSDQAVKTKGLSPIRENHDLEGSVLPCHADDCRENVTEAQNSVQDHSFIPEGIALPRLVLCLAHNGKVAWDMKWRPSDAVDSKAKHHLGYLAVLLGNGSLEVWEVPVHSLVKLFYAGCHTEGTDPRFLKLQPVFRCSRMKFGERQSIPLALEWSPSASRDLILAGCHDGTVAMWKFCSQLSSKDTKPLLCFTADTVSIRSLAWAPDDSDAECSNLIVTAGHEGLKFWDLRSPYRPLFELCPVQRAVLGLDWLKDPRCLVIAYEDGIMRTLSLTKIANDMPVTGEPSARTKQPGLHCQSCSFFSIWSVQVSRSTGLVAYCSSDGCTRYFQLTTEAVDKDSSRYRKPHFLCGSLAEEGPTLSINTPLKSIPLPKQPLVSKVVASEARPINSSIPALCWYDHATNNNSSQKKRKDNPSKQAKAGEGALQDIDSRGDKRRQNIEIFPPKIVAMNKVRWNMNKGSGRWLCYGGAAGIVRCQVISPR